MVEFNPTASDNRQPRCACVLVLDISGSMQGEPIRKLNEALPALANDLIGDKLASKRVELAIVSFPPVRATVPFCGPAAFKPPSLVASGATPLGEAVHHALAMIEERKAYYRAMHLAYFRPWLFMVTDGSPSDGDDWRGAAKATRDLEDRKKLSVFAVGVPGADMDVLAQFSRRKPMNLIGLKFNEMFEWVSSSLGATSNSGSHSSGNPDEAVTYGEISWGSQS